MKVWLKKKSADWLMLRDKLPPSGIQTNDLDAYVKFDFPYPSTVRRCSSFSLSQPPQAAETIHAADFPPESLCFCFRSSRRNTKQLSSRTPTPQVRPERRCGCACVMFVSTTCNCGDISPQIDVNRLVLYCTLQCFPRDRKDEALHECDAAVQIRQREETKSTHEPLK